MQKILLTFKYSSEFEKHRITSTLHEADWFIKNGYSPWINLPCGKKLEEVMENESIDYLLNEAEKEYSEEYFKKIEEKITEQWEQYVPLFNTYFEETHLHLEDAYEVYLTKYGVGGSYNLPQKIIINIQRKSDDGIMKTLIHELVHLSIQSLIEKYDVEHWIKERLVDLILEKNFPGLIKRQGIPIDTERIDESFEKNYPNIEEVIKNI